MLTILDVKLKFPSYVVGQRNPVRVNSHPFKSVLPVAPHGTVQPLLTVPIMCLLALEEHSWQKQVHN